MRWPDPGIEAIEPVTQRPERMFNLADFDRSGLPSVLSER